MRTKGEEEEEDHRESCCLIRSLKKKNYGELHRNRRSLSSPSGDCHQVNRSGPSCQFCESKWTKQPILAKAKTYVAQTGCRVKDTIE